jgi:hypothetical protein
MISADNVYANGKNISSDLSNLNKRLSNTENIAIRNKNYYDSVINLFDKKIIEQDQAISELRDKNGTAKVIQKELWLDLSFLIACSIIIIINILISILIINKKYKIVDERSDRHREEINELKKSNSNIVLPKANNLIKSDFEISDINKVEKVVSKTFNTPDNEMNNTLVNKKSTDNNKNDRDSVGNKSISSNSIPLYEAPKVFYMGDPYENDFLINSKSDTYSIGATMYKFYILSQNESEFEFISDYETIKQIHVNNISSLRSACKSENEYNSSISRVVTVKKGKARFQEDKWVIIEKAKIRFE